ncbi:MAG: aspartate-alanine antiporter [Candidatus Omnitrophota bacterium]
MERGEMMVQNIIDVFRAYPQIAVFLALAAGYQIGKIKIFGFSFGSTVGVLVAALVLGQMGIDVPQMAKAIGFALFIFCIGYKVGPQFFGALKKDGIKYVWLSLFVAVVGLVTAVLLAKAFGFDSGTAAGMISGAMTQSAIIGTADGAIKQLAISGVQKTLLESNVAIAYAITYIFGVAGLIVFFKLVPRLLGWDLKAEARKLEKAMSGSGDEGMSPELFSWYKRLNLRAYKVTNEQVSGKSVRELEGLFNSRVVVDKLKKKDGVIDPDPETRIESGDIVAIVGNRRVFPKANEMIGPEVDDKDVEDILGEILDICVIKKEAVGKTLGQISGEYGHGCFLRKITRQGHEIPLLRDTVVNKCDILQVAGAQKDVEKFVAYLGYPERQTEVTDMVIVGIGCVLGTLLGLLSVPVFGIPLTLGVGGGVLVSGLVFGWLRSLHPTFGQIPAGAQWVFTNFGLNLFIACVGLTAGPKALDALKSAGLVLFFAGVILTLTPHILGLIFGRFVLKMNPLLLLGALTGAGTATPSLNVLKEASDSSVPALGYAVPFAIGNFILTVWGTLIVHLV